MLENDDAAYHVFFRWVSGRVCLGWPWPVNFALDAGLFSMPVSGRTIATRMFATASSPQRAVVCVLLRSSTYGTFQCFFTRLTKNTSLRSPQLFTRDQAGHGIYFLQGRRQNARRSGIGWSGGSNILLCFVLFYSSLPSATNCELALVTGNTSTPCFC